MLDRVCAFVLTRDRRELLVATLRALLDQTHPVEHVIVLDNASGDGTVEYLGACGLLADPRLELHRNDANTGGAGGYGRGIELARARSEGWIWLMDDDAEPRLDALERLLEAPAAREPDTVALATAVLHPDGTVDRMHRCRLHRLITPLGQEAYAVGRYPDVDCASFVGLLVKTAAARAVELPRAEFFLGYDDAEYSLRLRAHGRIRLVAESEIVHKIPIGGGRSTRRSRVVNRILGAQYGSAPWSAYWKDLYRVRNFMALRCTHGGLGALEFWLLTATYLVKALLYDERPLRALPWIVRFARRGRRGDFRAPSPEQWQRESSS